MLTLIGVAVVVIGFALRLNPLLVVTVAALVTASAGGMNPIAAISAFGKAFNDNRFVSVVWLVLPVIGVLERYGLQERARTLIGRLRRATAGRILMAYFIVRQLVAALGLNALGGHAAMVRPLIAPMAEAAGEAQTGGLTDPERETVRAYAAASENTAAFFGEDIFIAFGSILLIKATLEAGGVAVSPLRLSLWAMPTAALALVIHLVRMALLDRRLARRPGAEGEA